MAFCLLTIISISSCKEEKPTFSAPKQATDIGTLRSLLSLTSTESKVVPDGYTVAGQVISNVSQEDSYTVILQDSVINKSIRIRFDVPHSFKSGDFLNVYLAKQNLQIVDGDYVLRNVPLIFANRISAATLTPRETTIALATTNYADWSSTLVKLKSLKKTATIDDSTFVFKDSLTSNTIQLHVSKRLNYTVPDSALSVTGYLTKFKNNLQIRIRTGSDIVKYAVPTIKTIVEDFEMGGPASYASGDQTFTNLASGSWVFNDASVLGPVEVNDLRNGVGSVRLRGKNTGGGHIYSLFDVKGLKSIKFLFGGTKLGEGDGDGKDYAVEALISKDAGVTWTSLGTKVGLKGSFTEMEYTVNAGPTENVRVKIVNQSFLRSTNNRMRANIDDVVLTY
ncbi:DUF5689 domain-containing protein [Pedobacter xixiisoli]|uniref:DUF5689 domain-containing protein n=1 Tax=Pedobacter xixiisoli TaxID=1476464 RepID=A0A286ACX4_9SPHI|nr:DUF5689 domain-containing protein [Pedobacter xixiisoli]SOD19756.1 hypothetical protein SAMN06297358_3461 [Pedobacter xixiisoli]